MSPRVSVILPNYNYARYLKERIRSILSQTMRSLELIYLDDHSSDQSNAVAAEFASDARMQRHCFSENSGQVYQRWNDGAALARGEWLWFAGADDAAHPRFLDHLLSLADRHPSCGLLRGNFYRIDGAGRIIDRASDDFLRRPKDHQSYFATSAAELPYLATFTYPTASALLIRRDLFERLGGFDVRVPLAADILFYLRLAALADVAYSAEVLCVYRDHRDTFTRSHSLAATDLSKCFCTSEAIRLLAARGPGTAAARRAAARFIRFRLTTLACTPGVALPAAFSWMPGKIHEVVPDQRLLNLPFAPPAPSSAASLHP